MFRLVILAIVALRVTVCPLFCAANASAAHSAKVPRVHSCCCAACERELTPSEGDSGRSHCPCNSSTPCCPGGTCQVTLDKGHRLDVVMLLAVREVTSLSFDTLECPKVLVASINEHPFRYDRSSGQTIRLVFESLLI